MNSSNIPTQKSIRQKSNQPSDAELVSHKLAQIESKMGQAFKQDLKKKIAPILPRIEKITCETEQKKKNLEELINNQKGEYHRLKLWNKKCKLTDDISFLCKEIQKMKQKIKEKKLQREIMEAEILKNEEIVQQEKKVEKKNQIFKTPRRNRRSVAEALMSPKQRNSINDNKENTNQNASNLFKSLNFQKLKHIDRLLAQMNENITYSMEKKLSGDTQQSITKKIFNNYSVDEYFAFMLDCRIVRDTLKKIEDS